MITFIPVTEDAPTMAPMVVSPGQLLSARERGAVAFRDRLARNGNITGSGRTADHVAGYKNGWDEAVAHLRMQGVIR